jgi:hypothetical protein
MLRQLVEDDESYDDTEYESKDECTKEPESNKVSNKLQPIEINGIKVFITQDELDKLEEQLIDIDYDRDSVVDHVNQTFMVFDDFINNEK